MDSATTFFLNIGFSTHDGNAVFIYRVFSMQMIKYIIVIELRRLNRILKAYLVCERTLSNTDLKKRHRLKEKNVRAI